MATLVFTHGTGLCKEIWDPIIRRLQVSPLLQHVAPSQFVTLCAPYHGTRRDDSVAAQVDRENPTSPRVVHPFNQWVTIVADDVYGHAQKLQRAKKDGKRAPLIGIGHSMGAVALWKAEVAHPGTFDGLILFEPPYMFETPERSQSMDFLVSLTLQRESTWSTREAAVAHFESLRNFASWDRESLKSYIEGAVVEDEDKSSVSLACHPHIEASVYSGPWLTFRESEFARPKCRAVFQSGDRTKLFNREFFLGLEAKLPEVYKVASPMANTSHVMVLEDPAASATKILEALKEFPSFRDGGAEGTTSKL